MTTTQTQSASRAADPSFLKAATPWLIATVVLLALPLVLTQSSTITIMNQMAITIVFALSYNMLLGQGGMLSFGHAVYMGLGGFLCMHLINLVEYEEWYLPLPFLPLFGGLFGLGAATLIGAFSTRRAGTVFAMISLGVGELIAACSIIIVAFFGGEEGISGDRTMGPEVFGLDFAQQHEVYYLTIGWMLFAALLMYLFTRTPAGRMANAVRDNEERAEFVGYSQRTVRYISFCGAGFFAGVAGGLFAINYEILTEENLNAATSGSILLVTFLGGVGFFVGPIVGAVVFTMLQTVIGLHTELWALYAGMLFVMTVMFFPSGLTGLVAMHIPAWKMGRIGVLTVPYLKTGIAGIIAAIGFIGFLEILFHARHAAVGEYEMTLLGITFSHTDILPWAVTIAMTVIGFIIARRFAPEAKHALEHANLPPGAGS